MSALRGAVCKRLGLSLTVSDAAIYRRALSKLGKRVGAFANLCDYSTGETIRKATPEEERASAEAARHDGGAGVIKVGGRSCYVE